MRCDQCQIVYINGIRCHETGCPEAWREREVCCHECGLDFTPEHRRQLTCGGCLDAR